MSSESYILSQLAMKDAPMDSTLANGNDQANADRPSSIKDEQHQCQDQERGREQQREQDIATVSGGLESDDAVDFDLFFCSDEEEQEMGKEPAEGNRSGRGRTLQRNGTASDARRARAPRNPGSNFANAFSSGRNRRRYRHLQMQSGILTSLPSQLSKNQSVSDDLPPSSAAQTRSRSPSTLDTSRDAPDEISDFEQQIIHALENHQRRRVPDHGCIPSYSNPRKRGLVDDEKNCDELLEEDGGAQDCDCASSNSNGLGNGSDHNQPPPSKRSRIRKGKSKANPGQKNFSRENNDGGNSAIRIGDLVWAHVSGYPWWPSKVFRVKGNGDIVVYFFGAYETQRW